MTNEEIIQRGILIRDETEPAQNTSERVGGVIKGIGQNLADKDTAIAAQAARNGYYQCTVNDTTLAVTAPGFTLPAHGGNIRIKMSAPATGACTLNINSTGPKALLYNGAALSSTNTWEKDEIISVFYDPSGSGQYLASNSQGGGGKAEKIKYDNTKSGLAADNVQEAVDVVGGFMYGNDSEEVTVDAKLSNYVFDGYWIEYATGVIKTSANYKGWKIINDGYTNLVARLGDNDRGDAVVAFYNDYTPSSASYMKSDSFASNASYLSINTTIPEGCKCIVMAYRYGSYSESTARIYKDVELSNLTSANYKQFITTDKTLTLPDYPADAQVVGERLSDIDSVIDTTHQVEFGKAINRYGTVIYNRNTFATDYIPVNTGDITWRYGEASSPGYNDDSVICLYNESKTLVDYFAPRTITGGIGRVVTIPSNVKYVRATFYNVNLDNRVITDANGTIFKLSLRDIVDYLYGSKSDKATPPTMIDTQIIGHGQDVAEGYPKDSMPLFQRLYDKGLRFMEVDVQITSDGILVCSHDETINAEARNPDGTTISGTIKISQHTYEELSAYDYGIKKGQQFAGLGLLKFEDFIIWAKRKNLLVWIDKVMENATKTAAVYTLLTQYGYFWNCFWESVYPTPERPLINPIVETLNTGAIDDAIRNYTTGQNRIGVYYGNGTTNYTLIKTLALYANQRNVSSFAFTYNSQDKINNILNCGVQGVICEGFDNSIL